MSKRLDVVVDVRPKRRSRPTARKKQTMIGRAFGGLAGIEYRLSKDDYVSGEELAVAIEKDADLILPDRVRAYLCRRLRGEVKKKPGPNKSPLEKFAWETAAAFEYREILARLQAERKARGGPRVKGENPPHIQAALMIQQEYTYFRYMSPQRIKNLLSSRK